MTNRPVVLSLSLLLLGGCVGEGAERNESRQQPRGGQYDLSCGQIVQYERLEYSENCNGGHNGTCFAVPSPGEIMYPFMVKDYRFKAEGPLTHFVLSTFSVGLELLDEGGNVLGSNVDPADKYGHLRTASFATEPGRQYRLKVSLFRGSFVDSPTGDLQIRCCGEAAEWPGARRPGKDHRECGDCGWQFCLPNGAWSTECEAETGATCGAGAVCGARGMCIATDPNDTGNEPPGEQQLPAEELPPSGQEPPAEPDPCSCEGDRCDSWCGCDDPYDPDCCYEDSYFEC